MKNINELFDAYFEPLIQRAVHKALKQYDLRLADHSEEETYLTAQESADFIGDALQTFYGRTSKGEINTYGSGKRIFCKKSELIAWKEKQRTKSKETRQKELKEQLINKRRTK